MFVPSTIQSPEGQFINITSNQYFSYNCGLKTDGTVSVGVHMIRTCYEQTLTKTGITS